MLSLTLPVFKTPTLLFGPCDDQIVLLFSIIYPACDSNHFKKSLLFVDLHSIDEYEIYVNILKAKNCRQSRLLSLIDQFVHPVEVGGDWGKRG